MVLTTLFSFFRIQISNFFNENNILEQTQTSNDEEKTAGYMVPEDVIIEHILPLIPIKPLTQFMSVSKEWYSLISSSKFMFNHYKSSLFDDNPCHPIKYLLIHCGDDFYCFCSVKNAGNYRERSGKSLRLLLFHNVNFDVGVHNISLVGCGNGLVCFGELRGKFFILWNPVIGEFHRFYPQDFELLLSSESRFSCAWGFGYVASLDDYKVVRIMMHFGFGYVLSAVYVYSLKSNQWRKIEFGLEGDVSGEFGRSKVVNETVYWTIMDCNSRRVKKIIAFDLVLEKFYVFPHLSLNSEDEFLCVLGGCLGVCGTNSQNDLMLTIYKKSCRRVATVRLASDAYEPSLDDLIGFTETGSIFMARNGPSRLDLVAYPGLENYKSLLLLPNDNHIRVRVESYVRSKVSPVPKGELPNASEPVPQGRGSIVPFDPNAEEEFVIE